MTGQIRKSEKLPAACMFLASCLLAAALWRFTSSSTYSSDLFYMIAEGRDVLAGGIKRANTLSMHPDHALVLQNWLSCVLAALFEDRWGHAGVAVLYGVPAVAVYVAAALHIRRRSGSMLYAMIAGILACFFQGSRVYWASYRPENYTLLLLLWAMAELERYRERGNLARLSAALFLGTALEANLHAALWPVHLCVLAAYSVPPFTEALAGAIPDGRAAKPRAAAACALSVCAGSFASPYGAWAAAYPFLALGAPVMKNVTEQKPPSAFSLTAAVCAAIMAAALIAAYRKSLRTDAAYLCAGFCLMALSKQYAGIFLTLAATAVLSDIGSGLAPADGAFPPKEMLRSAAAMAAASIMVLGAVGFLARNAAPGRLTDRATHAMAAYILDRRAETGLEMNVAGGCTVLSALEYEGVRGTFMDNRIEMLSPAMNRTEDLFPAHEWMRVGLLPDGQAADGLGEWLDGQGIRFIADATVYPAFPYLAGWAASSGGWRIVPEASSDTFTLWERVPEN